MNQNTHVAPCGDALHIALLETSDGILAVPYGSADKHNTVCIEGVKPDRGTEITLSFDADNTHTFSESDSGITAHIGYLLAEDGTKNATLTVKRRGRINLTAELCLTVRDGRLIAPDAVKPEAITTIMSELARLKGVNRKTQKRLRAIERSLGNFAWI